MGLFYWKRMIEYHSFFLIYNIEWHDNSQFIILSTEQFKNFYPPLRHTSPFSILFLLVVSYLFSSSHYLSLPTFAIHLIDLCQISVYILRAVSVPALTPQQRVEITAQGGIIFRRAGMERKYGLLLYMSALMSSEGGNVQVINMIDKLLLFFSIL